MSAVSPSRLENQDMNQEPTWFERQIYDSLQSLTKEVADLKSSIAVTNSQCSGCHGPDGTLHRLDARVGSLERRQWYAMGVGAAILLAADWAKSAVFGK